MRIEMKATAKQKVSDVAATPNSLVRRKPLIRLLKTVINFLLSYQDSIFVLSSRFIFVRNSKEAAA